MSTATAPRPLVARLSDGPTYFLLRRLHSLTGIVFGGYLVVHLVINATIAQAGTVYGVQVQKIHQLPFLWALEWGLIYLPILYHIVYGTWVTFTGRPNNDRYPYVRNWSYLLQRISAGVILLFMVFHVFSLKYGWFGKGLTFDPYHASGTIGRHMAHAWVWPIYVLGILASCFHLANGFWAAAITWGLTVSASAQRRWAGVCVAIFAVTLVCGLVAFVSAARMDWPAVMQQTPEFLTHGRLPD